MGKERKKVEAEHRIENMLKRCRQRLSVWRYLLFTVVAAGVLAAVLSGRTMPFAEGWYTYYAQCINRGEVLYKDFDYLFTPLYISLISLLTRIFGYEIIVLRIMGVALFCLIAAVVFLVLREMFRETWACAAAVTAVFYLQSEVAQVFYDYVRLMDLFAWLTVLFLVRAVKRREAEKTRNYYLPLFAAGVCNACFYLVKQNMGLVFAAYALVFVVFFQVVSRKPAHRILKSTVLYLDGLLAPILFTYAVMLWRGNFFPYLEQTGTDAVAAKGGIYAILFGWIGNNLPAFRAGMGYAAVVLCLLGVSCFFKRKRIRKYCLKKSGGGCNGRAKWWDRCGILFCVCVTVYTLMAACFGKAAGVTEGCSYLSPYSVFLVVFPLFCIVTGHTVWRFLGKKEISGKELSYVAVTGSYFAVSYGCGMSGGLVEGQASIGVAFAAALLLDGFRFRFSEGLRVFVLLACLVVTVQSAGKKMTHPYYWWGMEEPDVWQCRAQSEELALLKGIRMPEETLRVYETVSHVVEEYTDSEDPIYCFPQIPVFYSICGRSDPGVRDKVQWFDVSSGSSLAEDREVLWNNPPKVVILYETGEDAYLGHERLFRGGGISPTREMRDFLMDYVWTQGYTFYGRLTSAGGNGILLYYKTDGDDTRRTVWEGEGTRDSPYRISSAEDLLCLKLRVQEGNDFAGAHFRQTQDLDLGCLGDWSPIGEVGSGFYFRGIYDGCGHTVGGMRCTGDGNNGLFGQLGGVVCNLGIVDSRVCGIESAGAVSYDNGSIFRVFALQSAVSAGIVDRFGNKEVTYCTEVWLESANILSELNGTVGNIRQCVEHYMETGERYDSDTGLEYEPWMQEVDLQPWEFREGQYYPVLRNGM